MAFDPATAKPALSSKTLIGLIAAGIGALSQQLGWSLDDDTIGHILTLGLEFGGLLLAAYGRITARTPISGILSRQ